MEMKNLVSFNCAGIVTVLTDGNNVYDGVALIRLNGGTLANSLLEALRQPAKYGELCAKMTANGYKLVGNAYVLAKSEK